MWSCESSRGSGVGLLWEGKAGKGILLLAIFYCLMRGVEKARFISKVHVNMNGQNLQYRRFFWYVRGSIITVQMVSHWKRLIKLVAKGCILGETENLAGEGPEQPDWTAPELRGNLGQMASLGHPDKSYAILWLQCLKCRSLCLILDVAFSLSVPQTLFEF